MALTDTIAEAIASELESKMDEQYASIAMPPVVIVATYTWDGSSTVTTIDTSEVEVGNFIRLDSDGNWYEVTSIVPNVSVEVSDTYSLGSFPSGSGGSSKALVNPPPSVSGTGNLDPFARGIADAFSSTPHELPSSTVASLPSAATLGRLLLVTNSSGSPTAIPCYSDGTDWRRVDTGAVVT